jgi:hypothetical protein
MESKEKFQSGKSASEAELHTAKVQSRIKTLYKIRYYYYFYKTINKKFGTS